MFRVVACALHTLSHHPEAAAIRFVWHLRCHGVMAGLLQHLLRHLIRQCQVTIFVGHIGRVVRLDQRVVT
jgi:hypothetical protein